MNLRKFLISLGLGIPILLLGILGFNKLKDSRQPAKKRPPANFSKRVEVRKAVNEELPSVIPLTGRLIPRDRIEIFAEVGGTLLPTGKRFREGNRFSKGQILIRIDDTEFRYSLLAQKSNLVNQITLILPDLKTDYPESYPEWKAYVDNFDPEKPLKPLPDPRDEQEKYFISARNLYNLYYSISSQEARVDKYTIHAPFTGVVSESNITEGTLVRVGQKLGEFFNPFIYELEAAVNLKDLPFFKVGDGVELRSEDVPGTWQGKVLRVSDRIDPGTQTVKIFVLVTGPNLREGMYLVGSVQGRNLEKVVEMPRRLLIDDTHVFIVEDSVLAVHPVEPVRYTRESVFLRGIPDGATLLNESVSGAFAGMRVSPYTSKQVENLNTNL